jgi:threonine aldolase
LNSETIDTNIVIFDVRAERGTAEHLVGCLREQGVLVVASGPSTIRAVTHLDVTAADVDRALEILASVVTGLS